VVDALVESFLASLCLAVSAIFRTADAKTTSVSRPSSAAEGASIPSYPACRSVPSDILASREVVTNQLPLGHTDCCADAGADQAR
jgi:hypothetical protein